MALFFDQNVDYSNVYSPTINQHQPFEQFAYAPQIDYAYAPTIAYNSSGTTGAVVTTKKEATTSMEGGTLAGATTTVGQGEQQDLFTPILVLGGLAVVGFVAIKYLGKKKKV